MDTCDFLDLPRESGSLIDNSISVKSTDKFQATEVLQYLLFVTGGVLVAGDRRATMGNMVVCDRAEKVIN